MQTEKAIEHIVSWLSDYAHTNGVNGFVVGISGGIDSALTSTLCAKTGLTTLCVDMPIYPNNAELNRAQKHLDWLRSEFENVKTQQLDLTASFEQLTSILPEAKSQATTELSLANTRARLRMSTLYYLAGIHGLLVAGTGNKVEDFGIGFFTKYGDGGVDISPIADLTKTEVYCLAEALHVDDSLLQAKPTDGLWGDKRSDEDQIGATYPELEWAMQAYEDGKTAADFSGRQQAVFLIYQQRHLANRHKWSPIPVCEIPAALKNKP